MLETKHPPQPVNKEPPQLLRPRVGTWLTPRERGEVELAAGALLSFEGRGLPQLSRRAYVIARDYVWLLAPSERSFDSRYLGPLVARNVLARVQPVWIAAAR
jgi:hypothetical protein